MGVTPEEIVSRKFGTARKGYDKEEVDGFLDEILETLEAMEKSAADAGSEVRLLRVQLAEQEKEIAALQDKVQEECRRAENAAGLEVRIREHEQAEAELREKLREAAAQEPEKSWDIDAALEAQRAAVRFLEDAEKEARDREDRAAAFAAEKLDEARAVAAEICARGEEYARDIAHKREALLEFLAGQSADVQQNTFAGELHAAVTSLQEIVRDVTRERRPAAGTGAKKPQASGKQSAAGKKPGARSAAGKDAPEAEP